MRMLRCIKEISGYVITAENVEIGGCADFLFDDKDWTVRYIVADNRKWLPGRKILISPQSIKNASGIERRLDVDLTEEKIKHSPFLHTDDVVTRKDEIEISAYYGWFPYWSVPSIWGVPRTPALIPKRLKETKLSGESNGCRRLRSINEILGYEIKAKDTDVGRIDDFIMDQESWGFSYLVLATGSGLPVGRRMLVALQRITRVDWKIGKVIVDLTADQIMREPEFDGNPPVDWKDDTNP